VHIAVATQAGRTVDEDFPGGGYVFDPGGTTVAETGDWQEGLLVADLPVTRRG
jgi:predicted amidohydrolase